MLAILPQVKRALPEARLAFENPSVVALSVSTMALTSGARRRGLSPAAVEALASALAVVPALAMLRSSSLARYHGAEHKTIGAYESALKLQPAGLSDDLEQTVDYGRVFETCRQIVESTRFNLLEALAEAIAQELLAGFPADEVTVRLRKPKVKLGGTLRSAGVEIRRRRSASSTRARPA